MMQQQKADTRQPFVLQANADATALTLTVEPAAAEDAIPGIMAVLATMRLAAPVDEELVRQAVAQAAGGKRTSVVIAKGTPVKHGQDGAFVWSNKLSDSADEQDGKLSHYSGRIRKRVVKAGDPLVKLTPQTKGVDGKDIFGRVLKARNGKSLKLRTGAGVFEKDGVFFAEKEGLARLDRGKIVLDEIFVVEDSLSFETGNIVFPGSVMIKGGVLDLFEVKAGGAVEIGGMVEAAKITAGGDVEVGGGIAGKKKGVVRAGGIVHAKFLVNAEVYAEGGVIVDTQIVTSKVLTLGAVMASKGAIAGGEVTALRGIDADTIGSDSAASTSVTAGVNYLLDKILAEADAAIKEENRRLEAIEMGLRSMQGRQMSPGLQRRLAELEVTKDEAKQRIAAAEKRRAEVGILTRQAASPLVIVRKMIYAGVFVRLGDCRFTTTRALKGPLKLVPDRSNGSVRVLSVNLK